MAKTNTIITIGRQYGSAGREIGYKVADELDIKLYDKEMLDRAAKESGIFQELFETHDEKPTNSFLYSLVMDTYSFGYNASSFVDMPISHKVFLAQFDTIKKIADEGPCIIVGRCADYALSEYTNCVHLFIYGNNDTLTAEFIRRLSDQFRSGNGRGIHGNLIRTFPQDPAEIFYRPDSAAHGKWYENFFRHPAHHVNLGSAIIRRCCNIKKNNFVSSRLVICRSNRNRISCINQIYEIYALYNPSVIYIQTWNNSFCNHCLPPLYPFLRFITAL